MFVSPDSREGILIILAIHFYLVQLGQNFQLQSCYVSSRLSDNSDLVGSLDVTLCEMGKIKSLSPAL